MQNDIYKIIKRTFIHETAIINDFHSTIVSMKLFQCKTFNNWNAINKTVAMEMSDEIAKVLIKRMFGNYGTKDWMWIVINILFKTKIISSKESHQNQSYLEACRLVMFEKML